jgi:excinuclease ABC subunit C
MVRFRDGQPDNANYRRYRIRSVEGQNDFVSMAEVVRRRYSRILLAVRGADPEAADVTQETPLEALRRREKQAPAGEEDGTASVPLRLPDLVIVDGGKGQVSAAHKELVRLGLGDLPLIGLAKEEELVFFPGRPDPVRIPHEEGALRMLQRIRDEAHRWANGYHQLLLRRRVRESLLDDVPGLGAHRKQLLLRHFGSVAKIRVATAAEIAAVKGIGPGMAERVAAFFGEKGRR